MLRLAGKETSMDDQTKQILTSLLGDFQNLDYVNPGEIPDIPLYMDQITTFMENKLSSCKRYPGDKILTKTMINNYTKNNLIPPPVKKKYSRDHLILLLFVYYLKDFLSISDIETLLKPLTEKYFSGGQDKTLFDIYSVIYELEKRESDAIAKDVVRSFRHSQEAVGQGWFSSGRSVEIKAMCWLFASVFPFGRLTMFVIFPTPQRSSGIWVLPPSRMIFLLASR